MRKKGADVPAESDQPELGKGKKMREEWTDLLWNRGHLPEPDWEQVPVPDQR